jgi:hypothetical protein
LKYCMRKNLPVPRQDPDPEVPRAHRLDREVVNAAVGYFGGWGDRITAVRAAFEEGKLVYDGSAFRDSSHVQIAVRDEGLIEESWIEKNIE